MKTRAGFEVKKLKTFPSMEYGDDGGRSCEVYLQGKKVCDFIDYGDGGGSIVTGTPDGVEWDRILELMVKENKRICQEEFLLVTAGTGLRKEELEQIDKETAVDTLVGMFIERKFEKKLFLKYKNKGYKTLGIVQTGNTIQWAALVWNNPEKLKDEMVKRHGLVDEQGNQNIFRMYTDENDFEII